METTPKDPATRSLAALLESVLDAENEKGILIRDLTEAVGRRSFGLLLAALALPSALPVPAPGYSTPFGIGIALIAWQMLTGRQTLWLPKKLQAMHLPFGLIKKMMRASKRLSSMTQHLIRPRWPWVYSRSGQIGIAIMILSMACLIILPIPLTNTFPAMIVFAVSISLSEEDGLLSIATLGIGLVAVGLYGSFFYLLFTQGSEVFENITHWIQDMFYFWT